VHPERIPAGLLEQILSFIPAKLLKYPYIYIKRYYMQLLKGGNLLKRSEFYLVATALIFSIWCGRNPIGNTSNDPGSNLNRIPFCYNCDGCDFTRDIGYRSNDSTIVTISLDSTIQTFTGKYLSVGLYEHNRMCDVPACLVEAKTLITTHNYGDSILCAINFNYSRSDSLYYYIYADLFDDSTLNYNSRIMYSGPNYCIFHTHLDTGSIKLIKAR
jgi:hypothetical protein